METSGEEKGGFAVLMGLDTPERAKATLAWAAPYVVFCAAGMAAMSWGIAALGLVELETWKYVLAVAISSVVVAVTLCLLRGAGMRASSDSDSTSSSGKDA